MSAACASPPPPPPPEPEPPPVVVEPFPHPVVWTARDSVPLEPGDSPPLVLARQFQRLEVVGRDTIGLRVRCEHCEGEPDGYVAESDLVFAPFPPGVAAWGTLAEFALSVRDAASRRDLEALRPVMADDFFFSFVGAQNPTAALDVWRAEDFATLDRLPDLLDQGLGTTDGRIWSAPPEFLESLDYRGLRAGFRKRPDGRWEWNYLIRGVTGTLEPGNRDDGLGNRD